LVIPVIGGLLALHFRDGRAPVELPRVTTIQGSPHALPLAPAPAEADRSPILATALVEAPAVRKLTVKKERRMAGRHQSDDRAVMSDETGQASAYSAVSDAQEIEKVGTHDQNIEPEMARAPKQNLARLEAIDAVRSLRLR
jgi:hypothetical protein